MKQLTQPAAAPKVRRKAAPAPKTPAPADAAARLGNRALQRLLGTPVQARLSVGPSNDPLEREADQAADQAMRGTAPPALASAPPRIQRRTGRGATDGPAPASVERTLAGGGRPLSPALQADMGQRLGHDFSAVRVHTDAAAARSARDIQANAYTAGHHVVFGAGRFQPHTPQGQHLLAHELAHTVQQGRAAQGALVQRDFSIEPTVAAPAETVLTDAQMRTALIFDRVVFTDAAEIEIVRDVLGIEPQPALVDEDLVNAIVRYQAAYGLKADGMLGPGTAAQLEAEIGAESDFLAEGATGTPLRRVARRLHLRAMVSRRRGTISHQGFVGDDANPEGAVTVRAGDRQGGATNAISLEYTGENSDNVDWLQFINMQMFATPPAGARVFNAGTVGTTGGPVVWSDAATTRWFVDALPASASPLYNVSGGLNTRAGARRLAMFDEPGGPTGLPVAQAFTAVGAAAAGAATVTMRMRFDSYVIRNNRARYHVSWTATTVYNITAGTSGAIIYSQGAAGQVTRLAGVHRTALLAEYAGNPIR